MIIIYARFAKFRQILSVPDAITFTIALKNINVTIGSNNIRLHVDLLRY